MKLGIWLAVAVVVFLWLNHAKKQRKRQKDRAASTPPPDAASTSGSPSASSPAPAIEHIVACHHCGLHVPVSDAVATSAGKRFCSEAHRGLHPEA